MKNLRKLFIILLIVAFLLVGAGICYYTINKSIKADTHIVDNQITTDGFYFYELFRTDSRIFWCKSIPHSESDCELFVSDINGNKAIDLGVGVELTRSIVTSPDKNNLVVIGEQKAIIISTVTLSKKVILEVPMNQVLGTYSSFPSFYGEGHWIDNSKVEISVYDKANASNESDPPAKPIEKKTVNIYQ